MRYEIVQGEEQKGYGIMLVFGIAVYENMELAEFQKVNTYEEVMNTVEKLQSGDYIYPENKTAVREAFLDWRDSCQWKVVQNNAGIYFERMEQLCYESVMEYFGYRTFQEESVFRKDAVYRELSEREYEKKYPEISNYMISQASVLLDDGALLYDSEWNGEVYTVRMSDGTEKEYWPMGIDMKDGDFLIVAYTDSAGTADLYLPKEQVETYARKLVQQHQNPTKDRKKKSSL